jgi:hypothetical protein
VTRSQVFSPGDVAKVGVKSSGLVGRPEEVAAVVVLRGGKTGCKINIRGGGGAPSSAAALPLH